MYLVGWGRCWRSRICTFCRCTWPGPVPGRGVRPWSAASARSCSASSRSPPAWFTHIYRDLTVDGRQVRVGCSIFIAVASPGSTDVRGLLRRADEAMHQAKRRVRNRYDVHAETQPAGALPGYR